MTDVSQWRSVGQMVLLVWLYNDEVHQLIVVMSEIFTAVTGNHTDCTLSYFSFCTVSLSLTLSFSLTNTNNIYLIISLQIITNLYFINMTLDKFAL